MKQKTQAVILVCVGSALIWIVVTSIYLRYVRTVMGPALVITGVALFALGLGSLHRREPPRSTIPKRGAEGTSADHRHHHDGHLLAWLLAIPIVAILLVQPPALGTYSAERSAQGAGLSSSSYPTLPSGDPVDVSVYEYMLRAVWGDGEGLTGRSIRLTGFAAPAATGGWSITRLHISCCAADAWAYSVRIQGHPISPPADTWVQVTGRYVPLTGQPTANSVPVLRAAKVTVITPPAEPYE